MNTAAAAGAAADCSEFSFPALFSLDVGNETDAIKCTIKSEPGQATASGGEGPRKTAFTFVILSRFVVSYLNTKLRGSKRIQLRAGFALLSSLWPHLVW